MPTVTCPDCGTRYKVPKPRAGKWVACKCGVRFDSVSGQAETPSQPPPSAEVIEYRPPEPPHRDDLLLPRPNPSFVPTKKIVSRSGSWGFTIFGGIVAACGVLVTAYFAFVFDTTVPAWHGPVHNIGLQQDRMIGIIVGVTALLAGIGFMVVGALTGGRNG